eukprot:TRINITY_DN719_c0_g8_i1.p1 TRINITY_DN719_c0_g8~~TRINITY_DN719_c0_g8_i1.p1  ORF type:complete len:234 (+),score=26.90 TRINITY_DN719_c0_g8_i1:90-791(+)
MSRPIDAESPNDVPMTPTPSALPSYITKSADYLFDPTFWGPQRLKVVHFIESKLVQSFLIGLLIVDVLLVVAEIILEWSRTCQKEPPPIPGQKPLIVLTFPYYWMHELSEGMHKVSIIILIIFEIELLALLFALGTHFFSKFMYVLDLVVVTVSLIIDLLLGEVLSSFILLFRLWRMLRIVHGVYASVEENAKKKHHEQNKTIRKLTKEVEGLDGKKERYNKKIEDLNPRNLH